MSARRVIASLAIFAVVVAGIGVTIAVIFSNKPPPPAATPPPHWRRKFPSRKSSRSA